MNRHEWNLKRNCSLSPRQLGAAFAILFALSAFVAGMFVLLQGAWQILPFTMLEMGGVALAFLCYARHATDHEHIVLSDDCLLVERVLAGETHQVRLDPSWTRVGEPKSSRDLIDLESHSVRVQVGCFVTEARRRRVALELRQELRARSLVRS
ncbi:MAG TPA: DUF2244 domain-containing protein [Noviherbaspirillum sp.]|uniref:DUF2244 domain-containing protein n=1 Tax=Noviherbaspirillum sp. TaxID=1926288 RepID=UPI002D32BD2E|nr:DUF2244 domain-containing protein [Noviherbaspirillum sp.]HYD96859.1 DUF2244 domain-containing protein [Noviherbaspirillum sp.]